MWDLPPYPYQVTTHSFQNFIITGYVPQKRIETFKETNKYILNSVL